MDCKYNVNYALIWEQATHQKLSLIIPCGLAQEGKLVSYTVLDLQFYTYVSFIPRFKPACLLTVRHCSSVICSLYLPFINITRSPPYLPCLYSSGHSIPLMASSQNTSGFANPDKVIILYNAIHYNTKQCNKIQ